MKKLITLSICICILSLVQAQTKIDKGLQKANQTLNKVQSIIQVFQPYVVKAQEIFKQGKDLVNDVKNSTKKGNLSSNNNQPELATNNNSNNNSSYTPPPPNTQNNDGFAGNSNYTPPSLPVNNPATINSDGTGNWGNQNNALYGNCLDVLTGTVMGMGEAEDMPNSVDVIFAVANGAYGLYTPNFIRNNATATYMTNHSTDGVAKWSTVNETEIAETKITLAQFDQIQTNPQISNVVKNATNYAGFLQYPSIKLEGKVFAIKAELENRTVYGLIAIVKHFGTDGSNGYLKIKVKAMGLDNNNDGRPDASMYLRH
ncbi:MAG: hypothetical protein ACOVO1_01455 [Chitinophagaceae bacterium]